MTLASARTSHPFLLPAMLAAQVGALLPHAALPAQLPVFRDAFEMTNAQAGWIGGAYYLGYMVMVPVLMGLTDRMDARRVYLAGALVSVLATYAFGFFAQGFWSAFALRLAGGAGLAALYMPGLRILSDRLGADNSRALTLYTAHYAVGVALSFLLAGWAGALWGWRSAFWLTGVGPLVALAAAALFVRPQPLDRIVRRNPFDFRPVLRNRAALRYVAGYAVHGYEMFAERAWVVAFLGAAAVYHVAPGEAAVSTSIIAGLTALGALLGLPGSVLGNEVALRIGRERLILLAMGLSFASGVALGLSLAVSFWVAAVVVLLHGLFMTADSGALTAGLVARARKGEEGVTIAFHSMMGFGASFLGPLVVGLALDVSQGAEWGVVAAWTLAGFAMGAPSLLAYFIFRGGRADGPSHTRP